AERQAADTGQRHTEVQSQLTLLGQQLEESRKQFEKHRETSATEQSGLETRIRELQAAKTEVEQQVARLTSALADGTRRRESGEQQANEIGKRRSELEAEVATGKQAQTELAQELQALQKQLQAQQEASRVEQARLEASGQDLQSAKFKVEQELQRLNESL